MALWGDLGVGCAGGGGGNVLVGAGRGGCGFFKVSALRGGVAVKGRRPWFSLDPANEKFFQEIRKKCGRPPWEPRLEPDRKQPLPAESLHQGWLGHTVKRK